MVMWTNDLQSPHVQAALHSGLHTHLPSHHNQSDSLAPQGFRLDAQSVQIVCLFEVNQPNTVNSPLTDAPNSGLLLNNGHCLMYQLNSQWFMYSRNT